MRHCTVSCYGHNILLLGTNKKKGLIFTLEIGSVPWSPFVCWRAPWPGGCSGTAGWYPLSYDIYWDETVDTDTTIGNTSMNTLTVQTVWKHTSTNRFDDHYQLPYCPCQKLCLANKMYVYTRLKLSSYQITCISFVWRLTSWVQILHPGGWSWCSSLTQTCWAWHTGGRCSRLWQRSYDPCCQTYTYWKSSPTHDNSHIHTYMYMWHAFYMHILNRVVGSFWGQNFHGLRAPVKFFSIKFWAYHIHLWLV